MLCKNLIIKFLKIWTIKEAVCFIEIALLQKLNHWFFFIYNERFYWKIIDFLIYYVKYHIQHFFHKICEFYNLLNLIFFSINEYHAWFLILLNLNTEIDKDMIEQNFLLCSHDITDTCFKINYTEMCINAWFYEMNNASIKHVIFYSWFLTLI